MTVKRPATLVIMGVSGVGKSSVMAELGTQLGVVTADGDAFHPAANVAKMAAGIPLTDEDRTPWLRAIAAWIAHREAAGANSVVACSALRRAYREVLRAGNPGVRFVHLTADRELLERRLASRQGHYMPPSLLTSQLATLEPLESDEPGITVVADRPPAELAREIVERTGDRRDAVGNTGVARPEGFEPPTY